MKTYYTTLIGLFFSLLIMAPCVSAQDAALDYALQLAPQAIINTYGNKEITYSQLRTLLDTGDSFYFLNVANDTYYRLYHIPDTAHIAFTAIPEKAVERFAKSYDVIVVYSAGSTCRARTIAACMLRAFGYRHTFEYAGGYPEWEKHIPVSEKERYRRVAIKQDRTRVVTSVAIS